MIVAMFPSRWYSMARPCSDRSCVTERANMFLPLHVLNTCTNSSSLILLKNIGVENVGLIKL